MKVYLYDYHQVFSHFPRAHSTWTRNFYCTVTHVFRTCPYPSFSFLNSQKYSHRQGIQLSSANDALVYETGSTFYTSVKLTVPSRSPSQPTIAHFGLKTHNTIDSLTSNMKCEPAIQLLRIYLLQTIFRHLDKEGLHCVAQKPVTAVGSNIAYWNGRWKREQQQSPDDHLSLYLWHIHGTSHPTRRGRTLTNMYGTFSYFKTYIKGLWKFSSERELLLKPYG